MEVKEEKRHEYGGDKKDVGNVLTPPSPFKTSYASGRSLKGPLQSFYFFSVLPEVDRTSEERWTGGKTRGRR
jgi:hypothetical protein